MSGEGVVDHHHHNRRMGNDDDAEITHGIRRICNEGDGRRSVEQRSGRSHEFEETSIDKEQKDFARNE